ncbi:MAG: DUF2442 domain-containing protein [Anaerolineae bacterium]|nr:DUF2442 domain-containing protein [Anaerolineae bacterium]
MNNPFEFNPGTDRPVEVIIRDEKVWVTLADGRVIANPLHWHPWLANATPEQQANVELNVFSVDWPDLDEGLDIEGMLRGIRPRFSTESEIAQPG